MRTRVRTVSARASHQAGKGGSKGDRLPFRWGYGLRVIKNCEPFVSGPLFAIQSKLGMIENIARARAVNRDTKMCQFHEGMNRLQGKMS